MAAGERARRKNGSRSAAASGASRSVSGPHERPSSDRRNDPNAAEENAGQRTRPGGSEYSRRKVARSATPTRVRPVALEVMMLVESVV